MVESLGTFSKILAHVKLTVRQKLFKSFMSGINSDFFFCMIFSSRTVEEKTQGQWLTATTQFCWIRWEVTAAILGYLNFHHRGLWVMRGEA